MDTKWNFLFNLSCIMQSWYFWVKQVFRQISHIFRKEWNWLLQCFIYKAFFYVNSLSGSLSNNLPVQPAWWSINIIKYLEQKQKYIFSPNYLFVPEWQIKWNLWLMSGKRMLIENTCLAMPLFPLWKMVKWWSENLKNTECVSTKLSAIE